MGRNGNSSTTSVTPKNEDGDDLPVINLTPVHSEVIDAEVQIKKAYSMNDKDKVIRK